MPLVHLCQFLSFYPPFHHITVSTRVTILISIYRRKVSVCLSQKMSTFSVLYPHFLMCCISIGQLRPRVSHKNEHFLKKVILGTLWVMKKEHCVKKVSWDTSESRKKEHFHKKVSWGPLWVTKNEHFLKKVSWDPMWVTKMIMFPRRLGPHVSDEKWALSQEGQ